MHRAIRLADATVVDLPVPHVRGAVRRPAATKRILRTHLDGPVPVHRDPLPRPKSRSRVVQNVESAVLELGGRARQRVWGKSDDESSVGVFLTHSRATEAPPRRSTTFRRYHRDRSRGPIGPRAHSFRAIQGPSLSRAAWRPFIAALSIAAANASKKIARVANEPDFDISRVCGICDDVRVKSRSSLGPPPPTRRLRLFLPRLCTSAPARAQPSLASLPRDRRG